MQSIHERKTTRLKGVDIEYFLSRSGSRLFKLEFHGGRLFVTIPSKHNDEKVFLEKKKNWIVRKYNEIMSVVSEYDGTIPVFDRKFPIEHSKKFVIDFELGRIGMDFSNTRHKSRLFKMLKSHLKSEIESIVNDNIHAVGKAPVNIIIKRQKTRWGSCSSKRNLNFNFCLVFLPKKVVEYIVYHELVHLRHMGHGDNFWNMVKIRYSDYMAYEKKLFGYWNMSQKYSEMF